MRALTAIATAALSIGLAAPLSAQDAASSAQARAAAELGQTVSSPTYRALQTVRAAGLPGLEVAEALGDGGQSMQGVTEAQAAWLRARAAQRPSSGNTFIVTHQPNLSRAFPEWGATVADGESVVLEPDGRGGSRVIARVPIDAWSSLGGAPR